MNHSIAAAEGWIKLGNYDEAAEELHNCPPAVKSSLAFVKLWVRIYAETEHWRENPPFILHHVIGDPDSGEALVFEKTK